MQFARKKREIHDIPPDEVEDFDAVDQPEILVESATPCVTRVRRKLQCQKRAGRDP